MNKSSEMGLVSSFDLIDAKLEKRHLCGSKQCPGCGQKLQGKPVRDWLGLPAGVKFDPTDQELIEHLEAKVELGKESKSHPLIDEFIPTIEGEDGICYTHPEKLPGVTRDGLSRHFFHRPSKAYTTGTRKRRKIQMEHCDALQGGGGAGETRWHKTGKTRPVMVNGKQKGCKKIMVLYTNFGKKRKPEKTNWIMHQYHLGQHEEEKEGELVASKIFYQTQPRQCNWSSVSSERNNTDPNSRIRGSGSTVSCSSKEIIPQIQTDEISLNILPFKADQFSFNLPFRKPFDQQAAGNNIREASIAREAQDTCEVREMGQHHVTHELPHHQINATAAAFHISSSRASHSISSIISQPAAPLLHHTPIHILDEDRSLDVPTVMLPNIENFQQQEEHDKVGGIRSAASGLEELIMGCTSSTDHVKQEYSSITNPQEAEWFKYSTFWADPDNPDYHGL